MTNLVFAGMLLEDIMAGKPVALAFLGGLVAIVLATWFFSMRDQRRR